jgi:hypothetical protein
MPPAESPPPSGPGPAPTGSTPPTWPDVSRTSRGFRVPVAIGSVLAVCLGGVVAVGVLNTVTRHPDSAVRPDHTPSREPTRATPGTGGGGGGGGAPSRTGSPGPVDTYPAARARPGDCVSITGPRNAAVVRIVPCGLDTYLVVGRFDGTADTTKCDAIPGSDSWFQHTDPAGAASFVLCLRK